MSDVRPDRHALLELDALLGELATLRDDGDAAGFDQDSRYRWVLHRLWIAVGNEVLAYTAATGQLLMSLDSPVSGNAGQVAEGCR